MPIIGDFHYNGHILLKKYPECARALAKYRINPGNVGIGRKDDDNFRTMIEVAVENQKPVRIGVNWGSLDQALLTRMMDENSLLAEPKDAREVTMEAMVVSALNSAGAGRKIRNAPRPDHPQRESQRRAGPDRRLSLAGGALQLSAAPRADRSRHGRERHRGLERRAGRAVCRKASATPSASRSRPLPAAIAPKKSASASRFCNRWAFAASLRRSPRAPAAAAPPARSSRRWPSRSRATCASRCRSGRGATPAWKR